LFGLGSNDAGASLVSLLATFLLLDAREQPYNLVFVASAEEENTGADGIESVLPLLGEVDLGVVGEPTEMQMAIAEKGLMVLDCAAVGKAGHAAREEGINAIILAMRDVNFIARHEFERVSELLGKVKMSVTQIEAGYQHNVVPDICRFVVDVRLNELYTHDEILAFLRQNLVSEITPRAIRLRPSFIPLSHPLVQRGIGLGRSYYGSPTLSDQALMPFTTIKIGVGDSARSHTADEFIYLREIREGIALYVKLLEGLVI
jgi:acetylornithine deacetylase